jgi:hypothetical protein
MQVFGDALTDIIIDPRQPSQAQSLHNRAKPLKNPKRQETGPAATCAGRWLMSKTCVLMVWDDVSFYIFLTLVSLLYPPCVISQDEAKS